MDTFTKTDSYLYSKSNHFYIFSSKFDVTNIPSVVIYSKTVVLNFVFVCLPFRFLARLKYS